MQTYKSQENFRAVQKISFLPTEGNLGPEDELKLKNTRPPDKFFLSSS